MINLIAYIPVLNRRHISWINKYLRSPIHLISQMTAEKLVPRLSRNIGALPTEMVEHILMELFPSRDVGLIDLDRLFGLECIMPDEDVCHRFAEEYLYSRKISYKFEMIWARWDMNAVKASQPIIPDAQIKSSLFLKSLAVKAYGLADKSPDWWRQIGAILFFESIHIIGSFNEHFPNEYETYIFGDPRLNYDAGQKGEYVSLHAEAGVIAECACRGISTRGMSLFVTTFPCPDCAKLICKAGIRKVFFVEGYSSLNAQEVFKSNGVSLVKVVNDPE